MSLPAIAGLYAITPDWTDTVRLLAACNQALKGGARVLQYRNKNAAKPLRLEHALGLSAICRKAGAAFIVNDDIDLALEVEADGVHLGQEDGDLAAARKRLGRGRCLGASCYNRIELATTAAAAGADHVAFGSMFVSSTKPEAVRASPALFGQARALGLPMVAIGGITAQNAGEVITAGASAIAVISDLFDAVDIEAKAREFAALFPTP
jgi:thiamine-phosphate pyrophosphorylase